MAELPTAVKTPDEEPGAVVEVEELEHKTNLVKQPQPTNLIRRDPRLVQMSQLMLVLSTGKMGKIQLTVVIHWFVTGPRSLFLVNLGHEL